MREIESPGFNLTFTPVRSLGSIETTDPLGDFTITFFVFDDTLVYGDATMTSTYIERKTKREKSTNDKGFGSHTHAFSLT